MKFGGLRQQPQQAQQQQVAHNTHIWHSPQEHRNRQHSPARVLTMKAVGSLVLCVATLSSPGGAFLLPVSVTSTSRQCISNTAMLKSTSTTAVPTGRFAYILQAAAAGAGKEPDVSVFDAEGGVSWEEYKKEKPDEFKVPKNCRHNARVIAPDAYQTCYFFRALPHDS